MEIHGKRTIGNYTLTPHVTGVPVYTVKTTFNSQANTTFFELQVLHSNPNPSPQIFFFPKLTKRTKLRLIPSTDQGKNKVEEQVEPPRKKAILNKENLKQHLNFGMGIVFTYQIATKTTPVRTGHIEIWWDGRNLMTVDPTCPVQCPRVYF